MRSEKEKWVEEVLRSTDGVSRALAPDMADAVLSRIDDAGRYSISPANDTSFVWRIAATVLFLLLLNAVTIYSYESNVFKIKKEQGVQAISSEFGFGENGSDPGTMIFGK